jgi:cis-3-alkyl-4-acyloxetan-2-one decarboxylase
VVEQREPASPTPAPAGGSRWSAPRPPRRQPPPAAPPRKRIFQGHPRRGYLTPYNSWANRIATHEFVLDIPLKSSHRSYQTLVNIEAGLAQFANHPILLIWGEQDWCFTTDFLAEWQQRFPTAQVERYATANHYVFEDAREAMIERVRAFLAPSSS